MSAHVTSLLEKITSRRARTGVIGLGYVGLPLAVEFAKSGFTAVGIDLDQRKVDAVNDGRSYIPDVPTAVVGELQRAGRLSATTDFAAVAELDTINICVPTPLRKTKDPDMSYIVSAVEQIAKHLRPGTLVSLESTTYPGTTDEVVQPLLEATGMRAGRDFFLAFSPERVDPGNEKFALANTPKIIGGLTPACAAKAEGLYGKVCEQIVPVTTPEVAEMAKLLENIFRSVNIALVNELGMLAERMGVDIYEVIDAAATKPFGYMRFEPGPGMGGHCLPVDPFYLSWKAREYDFSTEFIELAGKVNQNMPYVCVERAERALNENGKAVRGSKIAILGVAYKPAVGDIRESPSLKIIERLQSLGGEVVYHDEFVPELPKYGLANTPLDAALEGADIALIVTAHPGVDHNAIAAQLPTVDYRGVTRTTRAAARPPMEMAVLPKRDNEIEPTEVAA